jgi:ABC-type cobalamin transport system permease subunit
VGGWWLGKQLGSAILPIGVVTAMVGVPIFLFLLTTRRR